MLKRSLLLTRTRFPTATTSTFRPTTLRNVSTSRPLRAWQTPGLLIPFQQSGGIELRDFVGSGSGSGSGSGEGVGGTGGEGGEGDGRGKGKGKEEELGVEESKNKLEREDGKEAETTKGGSSNNQVAESSKSQNATSSSSSSSTPPSSSSSSTPPSSSSSSSSRPPRRPTITSLSKPQIPAHYPQVLCLPITRRPLFPGFYKAVVIKNPGVIAAIKEMMQRGQPYLGCFLLKDSEDGDTDV